MQSRAPLSSSAPLERLIAAGLAAMASLAAGRFIFCESRGCGGESSAGLRVHVQHEATEQGAAIHSEVNSERAERALCARGQPHLDLLSTALRLAVSARTAAGQGCDARCLVCFDGCGRERGAHPAVLEGQQSLHYAAPVPDIQAGAGERAQGAQSSRGEPHLDADIRVWVPSLVEVPGGPQCAAAPIFILSSSIR